MSLRTHYLGSAAKFARQWFDGKWKLAEPATGTVTDYLPRGGIDPALARPRPFTLPEPVAE